VEVSINPNNNEEIIVNFELTEKGKKNKYGSVECLHQIEEMMENIAQKKYGVEPRKVNPYAESSTMLAKALFDTPEHSEDVWALQYVGANDIHGNMDDEHHFYNGIFTFLDAIYKASVAFGNEDFEIDFEEEEDDYENDEEEWP
jgi:hypothetical protein